MSEELDRLIARLRELSDAVTNGREAVAREFTMRVPAEPDRDADLVLSAAADALLAAARERDELRAWQREAVQWMRESHAPPHGDDKMRDLLARVTP